MKEYNIDVKLKMIELDGRVLEAPDIAYNNGKSVTTEKIAQNGCWNHKGFQFIDSVKIERWLILNIATGVELLTSQIQEFSEMLVRIGKSYGIQIKPRLENKFKQLPNKVNLELLIRETIGKYHVNTEKLDFILFILDMNSSSDYKIIKTQGDLIHGIPTQAVEVENVLESNYQIISNILLKINTKLGGQNFMLSPKNEL